MRLPRDDQHSIYPVILKTASFSWQDTEWKCKTCNDQSIKIRFHREKGCCNEWENVPTCPNDPIWKKEEEEQVNTAT